MISFAGVNVREDGKEEESLRIGFRGLRSLRGLRGYSHIPHPQLKLWAKRSPRMRESFEEYCDGIDDPLF